MEQLVAGARAVHVPAMVPAMVPAGVTAEATELVSGEPPVASGATQDTARVVPEGTADTEVGASGAVCGVTGPTKAAGPVNPWVFVAATENEYDVPWVRLEKVQVVGSPSETTT